MHKRLPVSEIAKQQIIDDFEDKILDSWEIEYGDDYDEYGPKELYRELHIITDNGKHWVYVRDMLEENDFELYGIKKVAS